MGTVIRSWWKNFLNLIYPLSCLICKSRLNPLSDKPLCAQCWEKLEFISPPFCRLCGRHLPAESQAQALICKDCQKSACSFKKARSVCIYDGIIKQCIHLFKYKAKLSLVEPLAKLMVEFAGQYLDLQTIDLILPVPLHKRKLRQRQFNQAGLLAAGLSRAYSKPMPDSLLLRIKSGPAQINLSQAQRLKNVRGAFRVKTGADIKDKNILLVDDVLTTKATANECAKMLLGAGAKSVEVLTLAQSKS